MPLCSFTRSWLRGLAILGGRAGLPVYRRLSWLARRQLDGRALLRLPGERSARVACLIALLFSLLARTLCWQLDLDGRLRDLVLASPVLAVAPVLAAVHRQQLCRLLRRHLTRDRR